MDGTITRTEILPCIASELGIADEMATLTKATMDGHIEFEPSFRLRCLLLGQIDPEIVRRIVSAIPLDDDVLDFIRNHRENSFIVTGNLDVWIAPILAVCGCRAFTSKATYDGGRLKLQTILSKPRAIRELRAEYGYEKIIAVGDGANDAAMLYQADAGVAFGGVHRPAPSAILASGYVVNSGRALCKLLRAL